MKNILTSFTNLTTAEGERIAYTYSVVDDDGNVIEQNKKKNFVLFDEEILGHLKELKKYISLRLNE